MQYPRLSRTDYFWVLLAALFLGALLSFCYVGHFTRYMADDYCTAVALRKFGTLKMQLLWYTGWTGRFSFNLALSMSQAFGLTIVPVLPALAIMSWFAASLWSIYQGALLISRPRPLLISMVLAGFVVFATANSSPNMVQSCYWETGLLTYTSPLILGTVYLGLGAYWLRSIAKNKRKSWVLALSGFVTFVAGGFSEVYLFMQTGALVLALAASLMPGSSLLWRAARRFVIAGLIGSVVALTVVILAPGNKIREAFFPAPPGLLTLTRVTLYYTVHDIAAAAYHAPLTTLLVLFLPWQLGVQMGSSTSIASKKLQRCLLISPAITFALVFICLVPGIYATSGDLPGRARIIPQFVFVCSATIWSGLAGVLSIRWLVIRPKLAWLSGVATIVTSIIILMSPLLSTYRTLRLIPHAAATAQVWDQTDSNIREAKLAGHANIDVPPIDDVESRLGGSADELEVAHDPDNWKNKCVAGYYEVQSITAK